MTTILSVPQTGSAAALRLRPSAWPRSATGRRPGSAGEVSPPAHVVGQVISEATGFRVVQLAAVPFVLVALIANAVIGFVKLATAKRPAPPVPVGTPQAPGPAGFTGGPWQSGGA